MKSFAQLQEETRAVQLDFLRTDLGAANTFLDVARTTQDTVTRGRNVENARVAYTMMIRMSKRLKMSVQDSDDLQSKLGLLKIRIDAMDAAGK